MESLKYCFHSLTEMPDLDNRPTHFSLTDLSWLPVLLLDIHLETGVSHHVRAGSDQGNQPRQEGSGRLHHWNWFKGRPGSKLANIAEPMDQSKTDHAGIRICALQSEPCSSLQYFAYLSNCSDSVQAVWVRNHHIKVFDRQYNLYRSFDVF